MLFASSGCGKKFQLRWPCGLCGTVAERKSLKGECVYYAFFKSTPPFSGIIHAHHYLHQCIQPPPSDLHIHVTFTYVLIYFGLMHTIICVKTLTNAKCLGTFSD